MNVFSVHYLSVIKFLIQQPEKFYLIIYLCDKETT